MRACPPSQIRLGLESSYASPFNVEQFEIEWAPAGSEEWTSIGWVRAHGRLAHAPSHPPPPPALQGPPAPPTPST